MSTSLNSIIANIDENFPIQGQDNPSQGFRDNFDSIKTALEQVTIKINEIETSTAQGILVEEQDNLVYNNFQGNLIENAIIDYSSFSFKKNYMGLVGTSVPLDLREGSVQKIGITGDTVLLLQNWPQVSTEERYHKLILHVQFNISETDPGKFSRKLSFFSQTGGMIKGCVSLDYEMIDGKTSWYISPTITLGRETSIFNLDENGLPISLGVIETTIPVLNTEGFPNNGTLLIGSEQITYTSKNSNTFLNCARGANATTPVIHNHQARVKQLISNIIADYEYVFEISSYDSGQNVFINFINKFIAK